MNKIRELIINEKICPQFAFATAFRSVEVKTGTEENKDELVLLK